MNRLTILSLTSMALLCLAVALPAGNAVAQEKQHVSYKHVAGTSKFTQQLNVDVGDRPNHIVRVYQLHETFSDNPPVINGLKLVEGTSSGIGDRIEGSGDGTYYVVAVFENGDKTFTRSSQVVQSVDGKLTSIGVGHYTGGTGRFAGIQGIVRDTGNFDLKIGFVGGQTDIEYTISK